MLLVGLCDSGKTLLFIRVSYSVVVGHVVVMIPSLPRCEINAFCCGFLQLLSGKYKRTQTSITDSSAPYKAKNDRVSHLDIKLKN